tara:strand:- start:508 stop:774 length:267 start_codon:yes stop_codon:yes gene_type:complete
MKNWKTTVTGIGAAFMGLLAFLASLSYQLGDIATIIPPDWKAGIAMTSAVAAFILRSLNAVVQKDRNVTGGEIPQTPEAAQRVDYHQL